MSSPLPPASIRLPNNDECKLFGENTSHAIACSTCFHPTTFGLLCDTIKPLASAILRDFILRKNEIYSREAQHRIIVVPQPYLDIISKLLVTDGSCDVRSQYTPPKAEYSKQSDGSEVRRATAEETTLLWDYFEHSSGCLKCRRSLTAVDYELPSCLGGRYAKDIQHKLVMSFSEPMVVSKPGSPPAVQKDASIDFPQRPGATHALNDLLIAMNRTLIKRGLTINLSGPGDTSKQPIEMVYSDPKPISRSFTRAPGIKGALQSAFENM